MGSKRRWASEIVDLLDADHPDRVVLVDAGPWGDVWSVLRDDRPFNYAALNNRAVAQARGELVALINNDIEVITPDWLREMVSLACQPGVGAVGAKLLYPDQTVQHAGIVMGVAEVAGHAHKHLPAWLGGHGQRARLMQSFSAVTAACLVVRKDLYEQVHDELDHNRKLLPLQTTSNAQQDALRRRQIPQIQSELSTLQESLRVTRAKLDSLVVRSPVAGRLTDMDIKVG